MSRDRVTDQVRLESLETLFEDTVSRTLLALYHLAAYCMRVNVYRLTFLASLFGAVSPLLQVAYAQCHPSGVTIRIVI